MNQDETTCGEKPLFTIITATFNAAKFLNSTIESIKAQKFRSFEWIIIDANSTDTTTCIIQKNISIFNLYISEKDNGIYDAWNKGIKNSSGQWIAFIGAGDLLLDSALQDYADLIYSFEKKEHNFISSKAIIINSNSLHPKIIGRKFSSSEFKKFMSISHVGAMHHKSLFDSFGLFSQDFRSSSDYEFLLRCREFIRPIFLNEVTVKILPGGISNSYEAIYETYLIHLKYHAKVKARFYYFIAIFKLFIRKNFLKI